MLQRLINFFQRYKVDANTTTTIFITIVVFGLGLLFSWIGKQLNDYKNKRLYKSSILHILRDFSRSCNRQREVVNKSLEKAGLIQGKDFNIEYVPIGTLDFLNRIDLTILVQNLSQPFLSRIFCRRNNSKAISKLIELISQIKISNEQVKSSNEVYFESYRNHEKQFYSSVDELRKINDQFSFRAQAGNLREEELQYVNGYFEIFNKWFQGGANTTMFTEQKEIVLQILKFNKKFEGVIHVFGTNNLALLADQSYRTVEKVDGLLFDLYRKYVHAHRRAGKITDLIVRILE